MTVFLLVGGHGTRLRPVVERVPKPMAPVGGRPFLEFVVTQLEAQGCRDIVMCTGHLGQHIEDYFRGGASWGVKIRYSRERTRLGTAGALRFALDQLDLGRECVVMNGDSFVQMDLLSLIATHHGKRATATLALVRMQDASRYGTVKIDEGGSIVRFAEKNPARRPGLINAGVYVFSHRFLESIPDGASSLERDVFPKMVGNGLVGVPHDGFFIDIGIPEEYSRAQGLSEKLMSLAIEGHHRKLRE